MNRVVCLVVILRIHLIYIGANVVTGLLQATIAWAMYRGPQNGVDHLKII